MLIHAVSLSASHFVSCTVEVPFWPPCFYWFFGSCFGSHDEAGLLAFEALQGLPRPARGTHGRSCCGRNRLWGRQHVAGTEFAETNPYGNLECGRAKSGRRDLMGSQRVARPSLERGMEAASGKKRTPQLEGVTEGRGGNGRKPPPPHTMCHTPYWASAGRVASITLYFSNAGNASAAIFWWFLASAVVLRKGSPASAGASAGIRACVGRYVSQNGWFSGPCLATLLPRLIEIARACNHSS